MQFHDVPDQRTNRGHQRFGNGHQSQPKIELSVARLEEHLGDHLEQRLCHHGAAATNGSSQIDDLLLWDAGIHYLLERATYDRLHL